jgi:hypothetical protein
MIYHNMSDDCKWCSNLSIGDFRISNVFCLEREGVKISYYLRNTIFLTSENVPASIL